MTYFKNFFRKLILVYMTHIMRAELSHQHRPNHRLTQQMRLQHAQRFSSRVPLLISQSAQWRFVNRRDSEVVLAVV